MSNSDLLQFPLFQRQHQTGSLACPSDIGLKHEPLLATAAASLQSSIARSENDASAALCFLTDSINKLAAAYEHASVCTHVAHSLRQRSPCLRPDDIMRCCGVASGVCTSSNLIDGQIPYPVVWGSDFDISCVPGPREFQHSIASVLSTDALSPNVKRTERSSEECSLQPTLDHDTKRRRTSESVSEVVGSTVCEAQSGLESTSGVYSLDTPQAPQATAASSKTDFDWLPGDGVIP
jgi:hypothetical protein